MDVVKSCIDDLHGNIEINSIEGKGTTFRLYLPLTLAILDGMLINIGKEKYIIHTLSILEIFRPQKKHIKTISNAKELVYYRDDFIPLIRLHNILGIESSIANPTEGELIVVSYGGIRNALLVDSVSEQYQIVLKSIQKNFYKVKYLSSATILGDGKVALILDVQAFLGRKVG